MPVTPLSLHLTFSLLLLLHLLLRPLLLLFFLGLLLLLSLHELQQGLGRLIVVLLR